MKTEKAYYYFYFKLKFSTSLHSSPAFKLFAKIIWHSTPIFCISNRILSRFRSLGPPIPGALRGYWRKYLEAMAEFQHSESASHRTDQATVVSNILCVTTGNFYNPDSITVRLVCDVLNQELTNLLKLPSGSTLPETSYSVEPYVTILASGPSDGALHRFVERLIIFDTVKAIKKDSEAKFSTERSGQCGRVGEILRKLGWTSRQIESLLERSTDGIKLARLFRVNAASEKMDQTTYQSFSKARQSISAKTRSVRQVIALILPASIDQNCIPPLLWDFLDYFLTETVKVIIDLILIMRYDQKNEKFLRYEILKGLTSARTTSISAALRAAVSPDVTAQEVREVCRLFCMNSVNARDVQRGKLFKPLISYL